MDIERKKKIASSWFLDIRDQICKEFESIELEYLNSKNPIITTSNIPKFEQKKWSRDGGGGGEMSLMRGNVFEKVGVNISTVFGEFTDEFRGQIPGTKLSPSFWASGISIVAHMFSPLIPAVHMNTRFISTSEHWFGGGADLNPTFDDNLETSFFHEELKKICDSYSKNSYEKFKKNCDEYFYIKHRNQARGVGGIFYDYLNSNNFEDDFSFTKNVGICFKNTYSKIVRSKMLKEWKNEEKEEQLKKRGYYTEFNLIYDRGTKFGLMTNGNVEAILMSLPPVAKW